jgi:hypothetical protein
MHTDTEHTADCLRLVARVVTESAKSLPASQQLMAFTGLAAALKTSLPAEAKAAAQIAEALESAEARQLQLFEILSQDSAE